MLNFGLNSASVLAQVNVGTNSASIIGIFLAVAGAALYFMRTVRPELSRDQDIFFAAVGLLCGFILIFQGWRLDPILQFGQLLLVGTTVFFAVESIRLRSIATQQAKRNTPIVDREREVSDNYSYKRRRDYEAEVEDDLEPLPYEEEEPPVRPRIRGSRDERSPRDDYYEEQPPRRSNRRTNTSNERTETTDKNRRRNTSARSASRPTERYEDEGWGSSSTREVDDWENPSEEVKKPSRRGNNSTQRPDSREDDVPTRPRKRRPPSETTSRRENADDDAIPTDYVPYKPIDLSDESDNSTNFDDV
ncbi:Ycf66 family protein [Fortiea sp. LEGE XX443]|uniref:Ycf66 family protein n=1 Tax=Fortiea sp. LEGE XX443 TaxID=1828611 RepID=UPI00187F56D6|nr:Ycf66 family protein [Fortiea sp. LEGE XX443]MBE9007690.1 Ycf66 family protein [Fortiea sp. LEGE XX443]